MAAWQGTVKRFHVIINQVRFFPVSKGFNVENNAETKHFIPTLHVFQQVNALKDWVAA